MRRSAWYGAMALLAGLPVQAMAADGYVTGDVTMRAGPDIGYPQIDMIPAGAPVGIEGCTDGWEWCDVVFGDERGWVAGNFIQDEYDEQPVLVPDYGERLGIPIVSFSIVTYWDRYYVSRPFYREREQWYHRPPPHHAPPPPPRRPMPHPERRDDRHAVPAYRQASPPANAPPYAPVHRGAPGRQEPPDRASHPPYPPDRSRPMSAPYGAPPVPTHPPAAPGTHGHHAGAAQQAHPPSDHRKNEGHEDEGHEH